MSSCDLNNKHCVSCEGGVPALNAEAVKGLLAKLDDWQVNAEHTIIHKTFTFKGFNKVMSLVNAIAWIANQEQHHPDMEVHYNRVKVCFSTHAINGLSENDFICAAKVDALLA